MAVFRIEKTRDYTVMANHHLKNRTLSLKAKGLLSVMLSLPEDWDYTLRGLAHISKESLDAIREGVRELERAGYIIRSRSRNEKGQLAGAEYVIFEQPQSLPEKRTQSDTPPLSPTQGGAPEILPIPGNPTQEKPTLDFPMQANPTLENPTQLNTKVINTHSENTQSSTIHPSYPDGIRIDRCRREVHQRIDYFTFLDDPHESAEKLDEIVELMVETLCSTSPTFQIAGAEYPAELVKGRFQKLTDKHIGYVMSCLRQNTTQIRNIKKYLLAALFNAPATVDHYYTAEFNHFYKGGGQRE